MACGIEDVKENLKKKKLWVTPKLFRVYNRRHWDLIKYDTKEAESFTISHDPMLYAKEGSKFWTVILDVLCKDSLERCIGLAFVRRWIHIDHIKWYIFITFVMIKTSFFLEYNNC